MVKSGDAVLDGGVVLYMSVLADVKKLHALRRSVLKLSLITGNDSNNRLHLPKGWERIRRATALFQVQGISTSQAKSD